MLASVQAQSTRHGRLVPHLPGSSTLEAKQRRLERCFQDPQLDDEVFLRLLVPLLPAGPLVFVLDRTNWQHGQTHLNLLVLGVVLAGLTLPLVWVALPHGGSSDTAARERLVARLLLFIPAPRWRVLVADREFLGAAWFSFLRRRKLKRCIRIRLDTRLDDLRVDESFSHVLTGQVVALFDKANVYGNGMQVVVTRAPDGDLVALATDLPIHQTRATYRLRCSVECTFSAMKSPGFGLEDTAMTRADRLERLFGLVALALACCLRVGLDRHAWRPIPVKRHGRRAVSLVRYGWEQLAHDLRWDPSACQRHFALLLHPFPPPGAA